ncbi:MAG: acetyl-CoA carboxylase biotin carboxyl carrier protein [Gemmataceae bacterium]|nr:acetyl-CoA carboxylase biotin carboxyl carrier protein [Gemmataceae bacterium]
MSQHDLSEIDLREGDLRIRLARGTLGPTVTTIAAPPVALPTAAPVAPSGPAAAPAKPAKALTEIKSPTPGTFYSKPNPESETFVRVGSRVSPTTVVCIIEAMKIFNEITADCTGVVAEILVENQQAVEYGQVLFRIDPTG